MNEQPQQQPEEQSDPEGMSEMGKVYASMEEQTMDKLLETLSKKRKPNPEVIGREPAKKEDDDGDSAESE